MLVDLETLIQNEGGGDRELLSTMRSLCDEFYLSEAEVATKWNLFACNRAILDGVTQSNLLMFRKELEAQRKKGKIGGGGGAGHGDSSASGFSQARGGVYSRDSIRALESQLAGNNNSTHHATATPAGKRAPGQELTTPVKALKAEGPGGKIFFVASPSVFSPGTMSSPAGHPPSSQQPQSQESSAYAKRQNSMRYEHTYGETNVDVAQVISKMRKDHKCTVQVDTPARSAARYGHMPVDRLSDILDARITALGAEIVQHHGLDEPRPIQAASQEPCIYVGRICCESEGRLNDRSLMLEGCRELSGGLRVHLDVGNCDGFALFPGQIVAVEGVNDGTTIYAQKVFRGAPVELAKTSCRRLKQISHGADCMAGSTLNMIVAQGPYTLAEDLAYAPLDDLLRQVRTNNADVLLLMGPFVDAEHPLIRSGRVGGATFEQLFEQLVLARLREQLAGLPIQVLLMPSPRDVHHEFVYPQPAMPLPEGFPVGPSDAHHGVQWSVRSLPNPACFRVNEATFAATSADVIFHLGSDEVSKGGGDVPSERIGRLASHLIQQRSIYPLFPLPAGSQLNGECLSSFGIEAPDCIILPSQLKHFVKAVDGTLFINPGQLAKGSSGGLYARIAVRPYPDVAIDLPVTHDIINRARVDITRV
jgi:DNA polymerase alpha subunit B